MNSGEIPPLHLDVEAFKRLIASCGKRKRGPSQKFVKKVDTPLVELPADRTYHLALNLAKCGLINQFTGI